VQEAVAREVAEAVVDLLERVEIEHEERERAAVARGSFVLVLEALEEVVALIESRELIQDRELVVPGVLERHHRLLGDRRQQ
jgi:hypothetical protein